MTGRGARSLACWVACMFWAIVLTIDGNAQAGMTFVAVSFVIVALGGEE